MAKKDVSLELEDLWDRIRSDDKFDHLRSKSSKFLPGHGSMRPKVFIVQGSANANDELAGQQYSGASGNTLRSLIVDCAEIDLSDVWFTSLLKYRIGHRDPNQRETRAAEPHLSAEWRILGMPRFMILLGRGAHVALAEKGSQPSQWAGVPVYMSNKRTVVTMLDPTHGLRHPSEREKLESHWEWFGRLVREGDPDAGGK